MKEQNWTKLSLGGDPIIHTDLETSVSITLETWGVKSNLGTL